MATAVEYHKYSMGKKLKAPYAEVMTQVKTALKEQGFGVLTEIDMKQTMQEKLGIDFRPYTILGACNPPLAQSALEAELDIGLLLPCNIIVYKAEDGGSEVRILDPQIAMGIVENPALEKIATEARHKLLKALENLG